MHQQKSDLEIVSIKIASKLKCLLLRPINETKLLSEDRR